MVVLSFPVWGDLLIDRLWGVPLLWWSLFTLIASPVLLVRWSQREKSISPGKFFSWMLVMAGSIGALFFSMSDSLSFQHLLESGLLDIDKDTAFDNATPRLISGILALVAYLGLVLKASASYERPSYGWLGPVLSWGPPLLVGVSWALPFSLGSFFSLAVFAWGVFLVLRSAARQRRWAGIFAGKDAEYRLHPAPREGTPSELLPLIPELAEDDDELLVRRYGSGEGAYRSSEQWIPVARVSAPTSVLLHMQRQTYGLVCSVAFSLVGALLMYF
jgi:hypothetical protein